MSEYWSATSGTALVFPKEEVRDFFHGKTELDAAGFIRADENDKRAPA